MASALNTAANTAHHLATTLFAHTQAHPGTTIPTTQIKEEDSQHKKSLTLRGRNIIVVGVTGAFTPPCNHHVPQYIETAEEFRKRGIEEIFVVSVNDGFVMKEWKRQLAPNGTLVRFLADDQGLLCGSLGLMFDASELLGDPALRFVIVAQDDKVEHIAVEDDPSKVTITAAKTILALL